MMIADNQVVVTAPALRADIANACSSFDHLGRTGEQCRGCDRAAPVQSLKRTRRPETRTLTSVMGHSRRPERPQCFYSGERNEAAEPALRRLMPLQERACAVDGAGLQLRRF